MRTEINKDVNLLEENIYSVRTEFKGIFVDSFMIKKSDSILLVDSGLKSSFKNIKKLLDMIEFKKIFLVSTHSHWDHTGSNKIISDNYNAILLGHSNGEKYFCNPELQWDEIFNNSENILKPNSIDKEVFFNETGKGKKQDILFMDDEIISLEGSSYKIIYTPGHSDCSICLYDINNKYLFSGDLLSGSGINEGVVIVNNYKDYINSIKFIRSLNLKKIFTSHNSIIEENQIKNYLDVSLSILEGYREDLISIIKRINKIKFEELLKEFSINEKRKLNLFLEITVKNLLNYLIAEKMIKVDKQYYFLIDKGGYDCGKNRKL